MHLMKDEINQIKFKENKKKCVACLQEDFLFKIEHTAQKGLSDEICRLNSKS
jgi:hypothetical protein